MKGNKLKSYKKNLFLNSLQHEVLVGTLLGDATIPKQRGLSKHNVKFEQKVGNKEYLNHLYSIFRNFVGTSPSLREIKGGNALNRQSYWFRTYRHLLFTDYYNLFYLNGKKIVPLNIGNLLTERGLAFWFMDDGHIVNNKSSRSFYLNTYAFTIEDQQRLCNVLEVKFGIHCNLQKDGLSYRIYIRSSSFLKFKKLVSPFLVNCMKYKIT